MLTGLIVIVHVLVALSLIMIILLQTGKGAGVGAAFGGASSTVFGATGRATFLTKVTIGAAVVFTLTSLTLSLMASGPSGVMQDFKAPQPNMPAVPDMPISVPDATIPGGPDAAVPASAEGIETPAVPAPTGDSPFSAPVTAPAEPGSAPAATPEMPAAPPASTEPAPAAPDSAPPSGEPGQ